MLNLGFEVKIENKQEQIILPQVIQIVEIIQKNNEELNRYIEKEMLENPIIEKIIDNSSEKFYGKNIVPYDSDIEYNMENFVSSERSFSAKLNEQLAFTKLSSIEKKVGLFIIDSLDENGYLEATIEEICQYTGVLKTDVEKVIKVIQGFEPAGICARNLEECLCIQLKEKKVFNDLYEVLIYEHLENIALNRISVIAKKLAISEKKARNMIDTIKSLDPKPGREIKNLKNDMYIVPDIFVEEKNGRYMVKENRSVFPELIISPYYRKLMNLVKYEKNIEVYNYILKKIKSAMWLINAINQRHKTILNVSKAIVKKQSGFFRNGIKDLKPLTMREIAKEIGVHESTISRTVNGKYLECRTGVYELRFFFTRGINSNKGKVSVNFVKKQIEELIKKESRAKPLSDQKIKEILERLGIVISRRTVAKYRKEMGFSSSRKRYEFKGEN